MMSDDLSDKLTNNDETDNTTQPTITTVFRLLSEVRDRQARLESQYESLNSRFESFESKVNSRFDALESRLDREFARIDTRFAEMSEEMKKGLLQLSDKLCDRIDRVRLHAEADYEDLLRRPRKLESKAS
jgi:predicted nuclease with TOPRIM domain